MHTDILLDETPDIDSDHKNILRVYPTEVFHCNEKKTCVYISMYLHTSDTKFVGVDSGVLLHVSGENVDDATVFTKASRQPSRRNLSHTSSTKSTCRSLSTTARTTSSSRTTTPTLTMVRRPAHPLASSKCTPMTMLMTTNSPSPSWARWTNTATANRTTSTRSGCTSRSTCVMSRRSTRSPFLVNTISDMMPTKDERGVPLRILP